MPSAPPAPHARFWPLFSCLPGLLFKGKQKVFHCSAHPREECAPSHHFPLSVSLSFCLSLSLSLCLKQSFKEKVEWCCACAVHPPAHWLVCSSRHAEKRANSLCRRAVVYRHIQSHVFCLFVSCVQNHLWNVNSLLWSNYVQPLCGKSSGHVLLACLWLMDCGTLVIVTSSYLCGQSVILCLSVSVPRKSVSIDKVVFPTSVSLCSLNRDI